MAECRPIELGEPAGLQGDGAEREEQRDDKDAATNPSRHDQRLVGVQPEREDDESYGDGCQESGPEAVVEQRPSEPLAGCERQQECCDRQTAVQQQDSQLGRKLQLGLGCGIGGCRGVEVDAHDFFSLGESDWFLERILLWRQGRETGADGKYINRRLLSLVVMGSYTGCL